MSIGKRILHVLVTIDRKTSKKSFEVDAVPMGRSPDCLIPLVHNDVSRKHATLYVRGTEVWIEDMGSSNGTFVNGNRIEARFPHLLRPTDTVTLGTGTGISLSAELEVGPVEMISPVEEKADTILFSESMKKEIPGIPLSPPTPKPGVPAFGASPELPPDIKERALADTRKEAEEIIRSARREAELKVHDIFERAQKTQKEADDFYRRRIQEASKVIEEMRAEARRDCDALLAKTRKDCEEIRLQTDASVTELRTRTRKDCDEMYREMEVQIRQTKELRLKEMEAGIERKEAEILSDARRRMEVSERELHETIQETLESHNSRMQAEIEEHRQLLTDATETHQKDLREEWDRHMTEMREEREVHDRSISTEKKEHQDAIRSERSEHEKRIARELAAHEKRLKEEEADHLRRIDSESREHESRLARESSEHDEKMKSARDAFAEELAGQKEALERGKKALTELHVELEARKKELGAEVQLLEKSVHSLKESESSLRQSVGESETKLRQTEARQQSLAAEAAKTGAELEKKKREFEELNRACGDLADLKAKGERELEAETVRLKKRLEDEKDRFAKEEQEHLVYLKQETAKKLQQVEIELLAEIARKKRSFVKEMVLGLENTSAVISANVSEWRKESKALETKILEQLDGQLLGMKVEGAVVPGKINLNARKRRERFFQVTMGVILGVGAVFGADYGMKSLYGPSPLERAVASEAEARKKDLETRKFDPPKEWEWKPSFVDAVIYTDQYVELITSDEYQQKWSPALAKHLLKLWKVDEDSSVQLASIAKALVKSLQERKEKIHPDFVKDGLEKMREIEKEAVGRMEAILGSQVRYESMKKFEKEFFTGYRNQGSGRE